MATKVLAASVVILALAVGAGGWLGYQTYRELNERSITLNRRIDGVERNIRILGDPAGSASDLEDELHDLRSDLDSVEQCVQELGSDVNVHEHDIDLDLEIAHESDDITVASCP